MASSNVPARAPEPQPAPTTSTPRPSWPAPEKPATRFPIRMGGVIPT